MSAERQLRKSLRAFNCARGRGEKYKRKPVREGPKKQLPHGGHLVNAHHLPGPLLGPRRHSPCPEGETGKTTDKETLSQETLKAAASPGLLCRRTIPPTCNPVFNICLPSPFINSTNRFQPLLWVGSVPDSGIKWLMSPHLTGM